MCVHHSGCNCLTLHDDCNIGLHTFAEVDTTGWEVCVECGARRHPQRIRMAQEKRNETSYTVTTSVQVKGGIRSEQHAMNIVRKQAREGYRDHRLSDFEMSVTQTK